MNTRFAEVMTSAIAFIIFIIMNAFFVWVIVNFLIRYSLTPLASLGFVSLLLIVRVVFSAEAD